MNVAALCLIIFITTRYLNYTQGMFWIVCFLMLREFWQAGRSSPIKKEGADAASE